MKELRSLLFTMLAALIVFGADRCDGQSRTPLAMAQAPAIQDRVGRRARRAAGSKTDTSSSDTSSTDKPSMGKSSTGNISREKSSDVEQKATVNNLSQSTKQKVDDIVNKVVSTNKVPGIEISIQKDGKTIYECGYGTIEKGSKVLPGPNTHYQIDSLTKVFTAFAVLRLVEEGKINLDMTMGIYVSPNNPAWTLIPIREYLGMVSGIPDGSTTTGSYKDVIAKVAKKTAANTGFELGLDFQPGSQYEYSNVNYFILGDLVSNMSPQKSFIEYAKAKILTPLGMTDTGFITFGTGNLWPTPYNNGVAQSPRAPNAGFSGGGFTSTMNNLEKFAICLYNREILSSKTYKEMWTPTVFTSGTSKGNSGPFGLGWVVKVDSKGNPINVNKGGGGWGWGSYLSFFPQKGTSVIVLHNSSGTGGFGQLNVDIDNAVTSDPGKDKSGGRRAGPQGKPRNTGPHRSGGNRNRSE